MSTAVRQRDVQTIAQLIQERLHSELPENLPLRIQCSLKQGNLLILGEHAPEVKLDLQSTFRAIQQAILSLVGEFSGDLRLYLKVSGRKQPYAFHAFKTPQPVGSVGSGSSEAPVKLLDELYLNAPATETEREPEVSEDIPEETDMPIAASALNPFAAPPDEPAFEAESTSDSKYPRYSHRQDSHNSWLLPLYACISIAVVVFPTTFYVTSRPCVIGECQEIRTADRLTQASAKTLQEAKYKQQLVEVQQQLAESRDLLKTIPPWSRDYQNAQRLLQNNSSLSQGLDEMIKALDKGLNAVDKGKNPPHPVQVWTEVSSVWSSAIAFLEEVPEDSPVYALAQQKLPEYRANLSTIQERISRETTSAKRLEKAMSAAKVAQARSGVAQSLNSWETIYSNWQSVINQLEAIPTGTIAYQKAAQLLPSYRAQLALARDRKTTEKISEDAYNQALIEADRAETQARNNQWSLTVAQWKQAISYAEQVPVGTFYYAKSAALIKESKAALQEAEAQLKKALTLQKARADLKKTCEGKPQVCEYTLTEDAIGVWLTADYVRQIRQNATMASRKGDAKIRKGVDQHVNTLRTALEAISDNARIPLELYDPFGVRIGRNSPPQG